MRQGRSYVRPVIVHGGDSRSNDTARPIQVLGHETRRTGRTIVCRSIGTAAQLTTPDPIISRTERRRRHTPRPIVLHGAATVTAAAGTAPKVEGHHGRRTGRYAHVRSSGTGLAIPVLTASLQATIRSLARATGTTTTPVSAPLATHPIVLSGASLRAIRLRAGILPAISRDYGTAGGQANTITRQTARASGLSVGVTNARTILRSIVRAVGTQLQLTGARTITRTNPVAGGQVINIAHANVTQHAIPKAAPAAGLAGAAVEIQWSPGTAAAVMVNNGHGYTIERGVARSSGAAINLGTATETQLSAPIATATVAQLTGGVTVTRSLGVSSSFAQNIGGAIAIQRSPATAAPTQQGLAGARTINRNVMWASVPVHGRPGRVRPHGPKGLTTPSENRGRD